MCRLSSIPGSLKQNLEKKKGWRIQAVERQLSLVLILFAAGLTFPQAGFLHSVIRF